MSIRPLAAFLLIFQLAAPARAQAAFVPIMPYAPVPYMPMPYYYAPPEHLELNNQYYDLSLGGLMRLCGAQPNFCSAQQQATLDKLDTRRTVGLVLLLTGIAVGVAGPVYTALGPNSDGPSSRGRYVPLLVSSIAGVTLSITGGVVMPHRSDLVDFINETNAAHPESPIRISIGALDRRTPGVALSMAY